MKDRWAAKRPQSSSVMVRRAYLSTPALRWARNSSSCQMPVAGADDEKLFREPVIDEQTVKRRDELTPGQVSRGPENDKNRWLRRVIGSHIISLVSMESSEKFASRS